MEYVPEYAKGEIRVSFRDKFNDDFVRAFGKALGYELIDEKDSFSGPDTYLFRTELGKEREARDNFEQYSRFVLDTDLIDNKLESRYKTLDNVISAIEDLSNDDLEIPDDLYNKRLEEIRNSLK